MVQAIKHAMRKDIEQLRWMTPATKKQALVKLHAVANKIGYPGQVARLLPASRSSATTRSATCMRANAFETQRRLGEDRHSRSTATEWSMTPPTVNAYYDPPMQQHQLPGRHSAAALLRQHDATTPSTSAPSARSSATS